MQVETYQMFPGRKQILRNNIDTALRMKKNSVNSKDQPFLMLRCDSHAVTLRRDTLFLLSCS